MRETASDVEFQRWLRHALEQHGDDSFLLVQLAGTMTTTDRAEAEALLNRAVAQSSKDPLVLFLAAQVQRMLGQVDAAWELRNRAVMAIKGGRFALGPELLHLTGVLAREQGRHRVARRNLKKAFKYRPEAPDHGLDYALALLDSDKKRDALEVVNRALRCRPDDERLKRLLRQVSPTVT